MNRSRRKTFHTAFDDEARHAAVIAFATLLFVGPAEEKKVVCHVCQADPHLFAVEDVFVAIPTGRRAGSHHIGAGAWFRQTISSQLFTLRLRDQILLFLFLRAPRVKRQRIETGVHGHHYTKESVDGFQFFAD